jgi:hypothetical protein
MANVVPGEGIPASRRQSYTVSLTEHCARGLDHPGMHMGAYGGKQPMTEVIALTAMPMEVFGPFGWRSCTIRRRD